MVEARLWLDFEGANGETEGFVADLGVTGDCNDMVVIFGGSRFQEVEDTKRVWNEEEGTPFGI